MARGHVECLVSEELAARWAAGAAAAGWLFPSDWRVAAVDAVCDALCDDEDVQPAAERLGRDRAAAGVSLAETMADIDALAPHVHARHAAPLARAAALGWAERMTAPPSAVSNPLTGLVTADYLQIRLGELYREADRSGSSAGDSHALVVVRLDLSHNAGWSRILPMILTSEALRTVFDGGQTLAQLGESVALALTPRDDRLARRARLLASLIVTSTAQDAQARVPEPAVWIEGLPDGYGAAIDLLAILCR